MLKYKNMKSFFGLNIIFFIVVGLVITSCKKENFSDHVGPAICATADFKYLQLPALSNDTVNFSSDTLKLTASFSEEVPWTILITGRTSKSYKKLSGYGKAISAVWLGNPDTTVFFK